MKPKIIGCDYCGELKPSTSGSKQVSNGQFQKVFLCDDCKPMVSKLNKEALKNERNRTQYLQDVKGGDEL